LESNRIRSRSSSFDIAVSRGADSESKLQGRARGARQLDPERAGKLTFGVGSKDTNTAFGLDPGHAEIPAMQCLNCGAEMIGNQVITKKARISYDMCEKCGSLWLDAGELDKMAFQVEGSIEFCEEEKKPEPESHPWKCPRCDDSVLDKVKFLESDEIFLHRCPNCGGFWLDGGELNLIDQELAKIMPVSGKGFSDFVNNVHVPYWFKRIQRRSSETDFRVGAPPIDGARMKGETSDECPNCGNRLSVYELYSMKFEACPQCKGIWLAKDELRKLKNTVGGGTLRWLNDEVDNIEKAAIIPAHRNCPHCKTVEMVSVVFAKTSILIDWCPQCHGQWLDRGEFQAIVDYLKDEALKETPKQAGKEAMADARRVVAGGPESRWDELLDANAALAALINTTIFEHPALFNFCTSVPHLFP
jgi:Zn-finger nucleic acid-binding protein